MEKCQRCKEREQKIEELLLIIPVLQLRIQELEKKLALYDSIISDKDDDDHSASSGMSGYLEKVKKKKTDKQIGKKRKKRRGAKRGHKGYGRKKCGVIDFEVDLTLDFCPDCGGSLREHKKSEEYVQEDLVIQKVATKYKVHRYECILCEKEVKSVFESGFIGPVAKSLSTLMHYYSGVTLGKIKEIFGWFGLKVSEGSLSLWGKKMSEKFEDFYSNLKKALKVSPYLNVDETGWPVTGKNHWMWVFRSPDSVLYTIDKSRGSSVVKDIIGENYDGVLGSDFYSAYNPLECKKQKCLVHLLRAIKDWGSSKSFEKRALHNWIHIAFDKAKKISARKDILSPGKYNKRVKRFLKDFAVALDVKFSDSDCIRIMKRLRKHQNELWIFLTEDVPFHNNDAELAIRRVVVNRKVSCGNRSDTGARIQEILLSAIQTAKMRGENLLDYLLAPRKLFYNPG